jgi:hypothetical protein
MVASRSSFAKPHGAISAANWQRIANDQRLPTNDRSSKLILSHRNNIR